MVGRRSDYVPSSQWYLTPDLTPNPSPTSSVVLDLDLMDPPPLSLSIPPSGARPTLDEVLNNTAPFPYTLGAFMAYLSQNHCLETLEFTLEAKRYGESYRSLLVSSSGPAALAADRPEVRDLWKHWQRLMSAYIVPGAPREINLPSEVRDALLAERGPPAPPPSPETLDPAVRRMHDLMEESIFIPFVNSQSAAASQPPTVAASEEHHDTFRRLLTRGKRVSPQASRDDFGSRIMGASSSSSAARSGKLPSYPPPPNVWTGVEIGSPALTDDSGSLASSPMAGEPMTPPTTPPSSELHLPGDPTSAGGGGSSSSPKTRSDNTWKKMGMKLGFKRRQHD
ncbi:hypothetical protein VTN31DRAFT_2157 [Thermomyces dupontii]|uniref:uncharacterized protein n=1 Tax=Talaromyces thermophilus TaxID=28565 RepID=UPI003742F144